MEKSYHRSVLVLPKLKAKAELLQALPELRKYFPDAANLIPAERHKGTTRRPAAPADDSDDEDKEAAKLKEELKRVKKERTTLLQALATARAKSYGRPAGDLQTQEITAMRTSLIELLSIEIRDCSLLVPEEGGGAAGEVGDRLAATLAEHEAAANEVETRTVQYQLLADRTTRDRDAAQHRMQLARELKEAAEDDLHTLSQHYYEMHAAKEKTDRELGAAVAQYDGSKTVWQRKLRDKRREMKAVQRRLAEETAEEAQCAEQAAFEAAEKVQEREAAQALQYAAKIQENNPAILARLQETEATWSRLRAVAGGSSPEEIITAWQDLRDRAQALQGLLAMTRRQEDQKREELAELQTLLQASQLTHGGRDVSSKTINANLNKISTGDDTEDELKKVDLEELYHQKVQSVHRLESLSAAAELSLKGLLGQLNTAQEYNSEFWKTLRANYQQQQQQQHRKSVIGSLASAGAAHPHRRASLLLPRRVSAVDLALARSAAAQNNGRRGSIKIPIENSQQQQQKSQQQHRTSVIYSVREGPLSSIQDEQGNSGNNIANNNILPIKAAFPASTTTPNTITTIDHQPKKNEESFSPELPDAVAELAHHFDLLLSLEQPSQSSTVPIKTNKSVHHGTESNPTVHADSSSNGKSSSKPSGYKRNTMAGPAWAETSPNTNINIKTAKVPAETSGETRQRQSISEVVVATVSPRNSESLNERQQAQHEVQAAERYMRRLVGANVEPAPEIEDPFALDSSDEDERPVFDRAALKHRSHKVTHPKQPRNAKSAQRRTSPRPTRGLPTAQLSPQI